jgi:UDPglucose 6-dehydrogenase
MCKIAVIGTGYVGLTTAIGLADFGADVVGLDIDKEKIKKLQQGHIPIYETGIQEVFDRNVKSGRLKFSDDMPGIIKSADVVFIGVGTPQDKDGKADLTAVFAVAKEIAQNLNSYKVIVVKSTVPIGTNLKIKNLIQEESGNKVDFDIVSNPEFLREGKAIYDFLHPDRVVLGLENERAQKIMRQIYRPLYLNEVPFVITDLHTAETIKYASNCFLAAKIAFINEMARLCDSVGANVQTVANAMGKDGRIGSKFLHPSPGYGGSCFPKDTNALVAIAKEHGLNLDVIQAVIVSNENQKKYSLRKIKNILGSDLQGIKIAVLGLAFKAETDDMRDSPAIPIINGLLEQGASICVYDPQAMSNAKDIWHSTIKYAQDEYEAAQEAEAILIVTEWNQFRNLDIKRLLKNMRGNKFFDFRNIYHRTELENFAVNYIGMGT